MEIQHGSLAAIRDKVARLLNDHRVLIVKPILARKLILKLKRRGGAVVAQRWSPKRGTPLDLFDELSTSRACFRTPISRWKCRWWKSKNDDSRATAANAGADRTTIRSTMCGWSTSAEVFRFTTGSDLQQLLPRKLPTAVSHRAARRTAQSPALAGPTDCSTACERPGGAVEVGKQGNARLYQLA